MLNTTIALIVNRRTPFSLSLFAIVLISCVVLTPSLASAQSLTSVNPDSGPLSGGNTVRVFGSGFNFNSGTIIWIGATQATILNIVGGSEIDVQVPPGIAPGKIDVAVFSNTHVARLTNGYSYVNNGPATLAIGPISLSNPVVGTAYSGAITVSGGASPYRFSISSGALPAGLTLNSATGVISGTPSVAGKVSFTVKVTDSQSTPASASAAISLTVGTSGGGGGGTLYVDANSGSDSNSGTQSAPLRTIGAAASAALANNANGKGTNVLINPGVYRESVYMQGSSQQTSAPVTFQAVTNGTAILDGADVLSGWRSNGGNEYVHSWQNNVTGCFAPPGWTNLQDIVLHNEMVFINGEPLTQILSASNQRPGTFFVNSNFGELDVWPPGGTNMSAALVEVASRQSTLEVHGVTNMTFRGLVFRHAASCINNSSASVFGSTNILFDQVQALWNNWGGVALSTSTNSIVQNSVASYNGGVGLASFESQNAVYKSNETDYNNWRGAMGALYDFGQGGIKFGRLHGGQVTQNVSYRNHAQGLWFDTDSRSVTISNAILSENFGNNLQIEANEGPIALQNSSLCSSQGAGLQLINTAGLTVTGNNFYNNGGTAKWQAQLFLAGNPGGRQISDWQTGQPYDIFTSNTTLTNNVFTGTGPGQYLFSTYTSGNDFGQFTNSLRSSSNFWNDSQNSAAFKVPSGDTDINGWQNLTGQDQNSSTSSSALATRNCSVPPPAYPDFNLYADHRTYSMSGGQATINLQAKSFGFAAATLSMGALPRGVSASFSASALTNGNSVLLLTASSSASYDTVPVTIFATSGSRVHSLTVFVTVSPF